MPLFLYGRQTARARTRRAFSSLRHVHERLERILALLGLDLCHLAVFKADAEVFDHRAAVGQRSGRIHYALGLSLHGACENLFAGDVGIKAHVCPERILRSGEKLRLRNESDGEIRSVCAFIVRLRRPSELRYSQRLLRSALCSCHAFTPSPSAREVYSIASQSFSTASGLAKLGEHLFCPRLARAAAMTHWYLFSIESRMGFMTFQRIWTLLPHFS